MTQKQVVTKYALRLAARGAERNQPTGVALLWALGGGWFRAVPATKTVKGELTRFEFEEMDEEGVPSFRVAERREEDGSPAAGWRKMKISLHSIRDSYTPMLEEKVPEPKPVPVPVEVVVDETAARMDRLEAKLEALLDAVTAPEPPGRNLLDLDPAAE